ncbi:MAG: hypothetical protein ACOZBH_05250 [Patescibacteria group bacterium]
MDPVDFLLQHPEVSEDALKLVTLIAFALTVIAVIIMIYCYERRHRNDNGNGDDDGHKVIIGKDHDKEGSRHVGT